MKHHIKFHTCFTLDVNKVDITASRHSPNWNYSSRNGYWILPNAVKSIFKNSIRFTLQCCYNNIIVPCTMQLLEMTSGNSETASKFGTWKQLPGELLEVTATAGGLGNCRKLRRVAGKAQSLTIYKMLFYFNYFSAELQQTETSDRKCIFSDVRLQWCLTNRSIGSMVKLNRCGVVCPLRPSRIYLLGTELLQSPFRLSLAWDHVHGDIDNPCCAITNFCGVIADPCGVVAIGCCWCGEAYRCATH